MSHKHTWEEAQAEELSFWGSPGAEFGEQIKQLTYAKYLGLEFKHDGNSPFVINKAGLNILDVGGGPVSLLLKTTAMASDYRMVADPCEYPAWALSRYNDYGIDYWMVEGEKLPRDAEKFDEVWMYNVLQHTQNPNKIFKNINSLLKEDGVFRLLDWIDTPTNTAHPISLTYDQIGDLIDNNSFIGSLKQETINENGAVGKIAYGVFKK